MKTEQGDLNTKNWQMQSHLFGGFVPYNSYQPIWSTFHLFVDSVLWTAGNQRRQKPGNHETADQEAETQFDQHKHHLPADENHPFGQFTCFNNLRPISSWCIPTARNHSLPKQERVSPPLRHFWTCGGGSLRRQILRRHFAVHQRG